MVTTLWAIDPAHSELQFKVKHLMITTVTGSFTKLSGTAQTDGNEFQNAAIGFTAEIGSISTNNEQRDAHLKSAEFFDAVLYPELIFVSTSMTKAEGETYKLEGNLTMHGITQPIVLNVEQAGIQKDPWGNVKAGFELSGKLSRKDFGLTWNAPTETGGVLVSDEVKLLANIQLAVQ